MKELDSLTLRVMVPDGLPESELEELADLVAEIFIRASSRVRREIALINDPRLTVEGDLL